jgi:hypothetical protein
MENAYLIIGETSHGDKSIVGIFLKKENADKLKEDMEKENKKIYITPLVILDKN